MKLYANNSIQRPGKDGKVEIINAGTVFDGDNAFLAQLEPLNAVRKATTEEIDLAAAAARRAAGQATEADIETLVSANTPAADPTVTASEAPAASKGKGKTSGSDGKTDDI